MARFAPDVVQRLCKAEPALTLADMKKILNISIAERRK